MVKKQKVNIRFLKTKRSLKDCSSILVEKKENSKRKEKLRIKIARLHIKITRQKEWVLHNLSIKLIKNYDLIAIENLDIEKIKKKFGKSVLDAAWGKFINMLIYKASWYGKTIIKVDRCYPSTKLCSECKTINNSLTLANRYWTCEKCLTKHDRDINAARNILIKAVGVTAAKQTWKNYKTYYCNNDMHVLKKR